MKIYLHDSIQLESEQGNDIYSILKQSGVQVVDERSEQDNKLEKIDLVIVSLDQDEPPISYIIALSIAKKKQVLCFIPKGHRLPESLQLLNTNSELKKFFKLIFFTEKNLEQEIGQALSKFESAALKEVPSIKFTLRITPSMERYLQWKSQKTGISKADFLRKEIKAKIISQDTEYSKK